MRDLQPPINGRFHLSYGGELAQHVGGPAEPNKSSSHDAALEGPHGEGDVGGWGDHTGVQANSSTSTGTQWPARRKQERKGAEREEQKEIQKRKQGPAEPRCGQRGGVHSWVKNN
jgi:hypothetical protein